MDDVNRQIMMDLERHLDNRLRQVLCDHMQRIQETAGTHGGHATASIGATVMMLLAELIALCTTLPADEAGRDLVNLIERYRQMRPEYKDRIEEWRRQQRQRDQAGNTKPRTLA